MIWIVRAGGVGSVSLLLLIGLFLAVESWPALRDVGASRFLSDPSWHPAPAADEGRFRITPMLACSALAMAGAVALAGPLGVASAVFCQYYAGDRVGEMYRHVVALLAGIPSVIYGLWGLVVLVPLLRELSLGGPSLLAGILVLALMILPTVALISDAALNQVPRSYVASAWALGMSRASLVLRVVLPAARARLAAAVLLGASRAIGETMAVLMVCGNVVQIPRTPLDPVRTLTSNIALEMAYALGDHRAALFAGALGLLALVAGLVAAAGRLAEGR